MDKGKSVGVRRLLVLLLCAAVAGCATAKECSVRPTSSTLMRWDLKDGESNARSTRIEYVQATLAEIEAVEGPIAAISIMGPYRSGKSFMLNQILPDEATTQGVNPFTVGHTVMPETEEVSVLLVPAECSPVEGVNLLVMDTPGLFAPNRAQVFDSQLIAAVNLMSSVVVFNSLGVIDRSAIEKLSLAVEAARAMAFLGDNDVDSASKDISRPHLLFSLQNFHLELKDKRGHDISPKQWIMGMLSTIDIAHNSTTQFQEQFNEFFSSLDAFPLPFPTHDLDDASRLDKLPRSSFSDKYLHQMDRLKSTLFSLAQPKSMGNIPMNGRVAANLIRQWTDSMNVPVSGFKNSAADLLDHLTRKEVDKALSDYNAAMRKLQFPMSDRQLKKAHATALNSVLVYDAVPAFTARVKQQANGNLAKYFGMNEQAMREELEAHLSNAQGTVEKTLRALQLPLTATEMSARRSAALEVWKAQVKTLRTQSGATVAAFDSDMNRWLDDQFEALVQPNVEAARSQLNTLAASCMQGIEQALAALDLPRKPQTIEETASELVQAFMTDHATVLGIDESVKSSVISTLRTSVDTAVSQRLNANLVSLEAAYRKDLDQVTTTFQSTTRPQVAIPASAAVLDQVFSSLAASWDEVSSTVRHLSEAPAAKFDEEFRTFSEAQRAQIHDQSVDAVRQSVATIVDTVTTQTRAALAQLPQPAAQSDVDNVAGVSSELWEQQTAHMHEWRTLLTDGKEQLANKIDSVLAEYGQVNSKRLDAVMRKHLSVFAESTHQDCYSEGMLASLKDEAFDECHQRALAGWAALAKSTGMLAVDAEAVQAFQPAVQAKLREASDTAQQQLKQELLHTAGTVIAVIFALGSLAAMVSYCRRGKNGGRRTSKSHEFVV